MYAKYPPVEMPGLLSGLGCSCSSSFCTVLTNTFNIALFLTDEAQKRSACDGSRTLLAIDSAECQCSNPVEMSDVFSAEKRSEIMSRVRSRGNKLTELRLIEIVRANHITGWRRRYPLFGNPDLTFPKSRVAVFVDGEFWHGHPNEKMPKTNAEFWLKKIERNKARDAVVNRFLQQKGWRVMRFWQRDLKDVSAVSAAIHDAIQGSET